NVLTYNGTSWSADQDIDSTRTLNAISCVSPSSCVAVDASGYRVVYSWSTVTSQFTWDATGSLPLLLSDSTYDYIYGPGTSPVEQISLASSTPSYLNYTQSDSTWLSTNAAGDETGFWGYDAFGILAFGTPTSAFGYAGQYTDATTGLSDMRARWYTPGTGLFTSVDPDLAETGQAYAYADDDPVDSGDPLGLCSDWVCPWQAAPAVARGVGNVVWSNIKSSAGCGFTPLCSAAIGVVHDVRTYGWANGLNTAFNPAVGVLENARTFVDDLECNNIEAATEAGIGLAESTAAWAGVAVGAEQALAGAGLVPGAGGVVAPDGGALVVEPGATPSVSELRAAQYLADQGNHVILRAPVGTQAGGQTSDLLVNGQNWDVYSPSTANPDRIISAIASKGSQVHGGGIIVDLSGTSVTPEQLGNVEARVAGTGARVGKVVILP
ncbi:MAG: RHS repeat-associated core domain-containing protein, partial [Acidimicrobiales bacterium]